MSGEGGSFFGERAISQLSELRPAGECADYNQLQESLKFKDIVREMKNDLG